MEEKKKFGFQKKVVEDVKETQAPENIEVQNPENVSKGVLGNIEGKTEQPQMVTLSVDDLNALMDRKIQEAKKQLISELPKADVEDTKKEEFISLQNTDDIPELENFEYKNRRYKIGFARNS